MAYVIKGVYKRKSVEHQDQQGVEKEKLLINNSPWSILASPVLAAEYAAMYGQEELQRLRTSSPQYDMVASYNQKWVKEGQWVPPDPKPDAGTINVYGYKPGSAPAAELAGLSSAAIAQLGQIVYERAFDAVTDALEAVAAKQ